MRHVLLETCEVDELDRPAASARRNEGGRVGWVLEADAALGWRRVGDEGRGEAAFGRECG